jgi:starch synthase
MSAESLDVAMVASEMAPFAKSGGLADVVAALPRALAAKGHRVSVFLPRYGSIAFPPGDLAGALDLPVDGRLRRAGFYARELEPGVRVVFVESRELFDRAGLYGEANRDYPDNRVRFALLARAALEYFRARGERPDVFHAHDWQAGLLPVYLKSLYAEDPVLARTGCLFTIHNLAYQGYFGPDTLELLGLPAVLGSLEGLEFHGGINFLKGGLLFAELLSTVSPRYAREIQTEEQGHGLDGVLRVRSADLYGILNGVDYEAWDPSRDPHIEARYDADHLDGKQACRRALLEAFGLPAGPDLPIVGVVSRLVSHKGFDVVAAAAADLLRRRMRMVVLGSGDPALEAAFRQLAAAAPDRFAARFSYDEALAHKVQAGADMFLMPSRYEPCGLTQMYSLRYGTPPVVRATGGLVDTVEPWDPATGSGTGFLFQTLDGTGLSWALDRALEAWSDRAGWLRLMRNGMARDFSWDRSARRYVELYRRVRELA